MPNAPAPHCTPARRIGIGGLVMLLAVLLVPGSARAEERVALVIGNSAYAFGRLPNPVNDANLMEKTLREAGFSVTKLLNADLTTMKRAMVEFGRALRGTDRVGLFYYAGHGVQVDGQNYLIPIGANISDEADVPIESVAAADFLKTMERSSSRVNIAIFDACRNNPFASTSRSAARGLAGIDAPRGTIIAYATAPGEVALDGGSGANGNSPYTTALARAMATPGITIEETFKRTRRDVLAATGQRQIPWESSSLTGDFYFRPGPTAAGDNSDNGAAAFSATPEDQRLVEAKAYEAIKDSRSETELKAFLTRFPEGLFAEVVKLQLARLGGAATTSTSDRETAADSALDPDDTSADGRYRLALALETGDGGTRDPAAAARYYRAAAAAGHAGAMAALGSLAERGEGMPQDPGEAARWYRQAADKGDSRGMISLAMLYEAGRGVAKDEVEAGRLYRRAAQLGSPKALTNLALMLREGRGMVRDDNEAVRLLRQAAALGYPNAMHGLAEMYASGRGVERDKAEAARWYGRAAELKHAPSQTALAGLLEFGDGVPKDLDRAIALYRDAAASGDAQALTSLAYLYEQGKGLARDEAEAARLYRQAADRGDARAQHNLAAMYHDGRGVPQDYAEAARLYEAAATQRYPAALRGLAVLYDEGRGVARDPDKAADYLLQAFGLGHKATREELLRRAEGWSEATRKAIQLRLRHAGVYRGRADGRFGESTLVALRSYKGD